ncbi:MAG: Crp/Fnr family transcriptional regulator [Thermoanaerobaculia bacterium]
MPTPYNLNVQQHCTTCTLGKTGRFCDLSTNTLGTIDTVKFTGVYPKGSTLFVEGEDPRGVFILCSGRVKLTTSSSEGKTLIVKIVEAGEILGVSAAILGTQYEVSAETIEPSQVNFVARDNYLRLLQNHVDASMRTAQQLSATCQSSQREIRSLGLSQTTSEKLAKLIVGWCDKGEETPKGMRLKVLLTHEEIAQMIGTTRETVTRLLNDFKRRKLVDIKGSTMFVPKIAGLTDMVTT